MAARIAEIQWEGVVREGQGVFIQIVARLTARSGSAGSNVN